VTPPELDFDLVLGKCYLEAAAHGLHREANDPYREASVNDLRSHFAAFSLLFARELCQIAQSPLGRGFIAI
jgi:hypothetical protein